MAVPECRDDERVCTAKRVLFVSPQRQVVVQLRVNVTPLLGNRWVRRIRSFVLVPPINRAPDKDSGGNQKSDGCDPDHPT